MKSVGHSARLGHALVQGVVALFGAGSIIAGAHNLFLRYYAREWGGIQFSGVNGCAGEERIANGDLISGQTLCNKPINFVPWVEIYRRHWQAALVYYGAALALILIVGFIWSLTQKRPGSATPYGGPPVSVDVSEHEHLR